MTQPPVDTVNLRSSQASAAVHQNFYVPPVAQVPGRVELHKCPRCGRRNPEDRVFDCVVCGRTHLCERHFDEAYEICADCARSRRGEDAATAARWSALEEERDRRQKEAATLKSDLAQRTRQLEEATASLEARRAELKRLTAHAAEMKEEIEEWRGEADQGARNLTDLEGRYAKAQRDLEAAQTALRQAQTAHAAALAELQTRLASAESSLTGWKGRAERAEAQLAEIRRKEEEITAAHLRNEEVQRKAEEEKRKQAAQKPLWQQIGIELVKIPAGEFLYGDNKEKRRLDEFWIAKTPVTNAQYKAFVDATKYSMPHHWEGGRIPNGKENHPVVYVSWDDAQAFCKWAGVRLPNEQEREKSARGTDGRTYPWGNEAPTANLCNFDMNVGDTTPVGNYPAGANGLYDMAGNVREWCEDWTDSSQKGRVVRGGAFLSNGSYVRCAYRGGVTEINRGYGAGFRVVAPGSWPL